MTEEKMHQKKDQTLLYLLLIVTLAWGSFWILMILSPDFTKDASGWSERGQFGDMFGALNALFSGLAFAGIIYTIRQQKEELELQREELRLTREELTKSVDAQQKAEAALNKQSNTMKLTAMLNANKSLLEYYQEAMEAPNTYAIDYGFARGKVIDSSKKINEILQKLENQES